MKKIIATICLFLFFQVYCSFANGVFASDKQKSRGVDCSAVAVLREHTASFVFPKENKKDWSWNLYTTKDNYLEYCWEISLSGGQNPSLYTFGAYLFKFPGSEKLNGTLRELLMDTQHSVFDRSGNLIANLEIQVIVNNDAVNILIDDPETFDVLFQSKPSHASFQVSQPDIKPVLCQTKIEYRL